MQHPELTSENIDSLNKAWADVMKRVIDRYVDPSMYGKAMEEFVKARSDADNLRRLVREVERSTNILG